MSNHQGDYITQVTTTGTDWTMQVTHQPTGTRSREVHRGTYPTMTQSQIRDMLIEELTLLLRPGRKIIPDARMRG